MAHFSHIAMVAATMAALTSAPAQQSTARKDIRAYIHSAWNTLTRSMDDCASLHDPKLNANAEPVLYLPHDLPMPESVAALQKTCKIKVLRLPRKITHIAEVTSKDLDVDGLLYLPNPYVVPGGRFNEMYGWDSYFIIRGLLEDDRSDLARGMVENFFFEIQHYGAVLNANRTYYLTRSQPPFLTAMIMAVYEADGATPEQKRLWLEHAYQFAKYDHALWTTGAHLIGNEGFSRYYDFGNGPVPEMADDPSYYENVAQAAVERMVCSKDKEHACAEIDPDHFIADESVGSNFDEQTPERCGPWLNTSHRKVHLTCDYYRNDRAMRESGFDVSYRFGTFGRFTTQFAPVCLNSLLFKEEEDLARMAALLGKDDEAKKWRKAADKRKKSISKEMWDKKAGMFFDLQLGKNCVPNGILSECSFGEPVKSAYQFLSTFYPLWVGIASKQQAEEVVRNLPVFEQPGGLATSARETGVQWDKPYGWAPLQLIAVEGLRRYGYSADADRIARKFASTVEENYSRDGTIREKYNVITRSTDANVSAGYKQNVVGFGWTNGTYLVLTKALGKAAAASAAH
jgi:alpha,alpha-trehalase